MAVRTDFGVYEEAVEQAETLGERVMIGAHVAREIDERCVAVARAHVPEHLIVGAILFDDIDHVRERRVRRPCPRPVPALGARDAAGQRVEAAPCGKGHRRERSRSLAQRVGALVGFGLLPRLTPPRIRAGSATLAVQHQQRVAVRQHRGRIPLDRNAPEKGVPALRPRCVRCRGAQLEHRRRVVVRLGHVEAAVVP